jgi:hypothetical protein
MGNFEKRLREYSRPQDAVSGIAADKSTFKYWADRASENSLRGTRAKDGEVKLHSTGKAVELPSTSRKAGNSGDPYERAKSDMNSDGGSSYMRGIRRIGK